MSDFRSVEVQQLRILDRITRTAVRAVPLAEAAGRTLAEDAQARSAVPPFDNSAMDGFAVRFEDVANAAADEPVRLRVVADVPAGSDLDPEMPAGSAVRIMTGAPVPSAADAIVPFEDTEGGLADSLDTAVVRRAPRAAGTFVRRAGDDVAPGDRVLPAGTLLGARQLGALASAGIAEIRVSERPRVAIVSTGSELVAPGSPLSRGRIPDSNGILLAALAEDAEAEVVLRVVVDDEGAGPAEAVREARTHGAEVVVFSGGVSAGAYEVVRQTLAADMEFVRIAMQPGKPQGFGVTEDGLLLFGLPGNPVSAAVSFEVFVRPALLAMQGRTAVHRPLWRLPAAVEWGTPPGRRQYLPAVIDRSDPAAPRVRPATGGGSGSHLAVGLGAAEAYAIVPAEVERVSVGDLVDVMAL